MDRGSPLGTWREQWERVLIGLHRIEQLTKGHSPTDFAGATFDLYGFFQHCFHLADWIENDDTLSESAREGAMYYARHNPVLRICADIANRSKHSLLDRRTYTGDPDTGLGSNDVNVKLGEGVSYYFVMKSNDTPLPALQLARDCIEAWKVYFDQNNITP